MCTCKHRIPIHCLARNHRVRRVLSPRPARRHKSPQHIFRRPENSAAPSHRAASQFVSEPTYQSLPLRRASEIHSIGTPPIARTSSHVHGTRLMKLKLFLPRVALPDSPTPSQVRSQRPRTAPARAPASPVPSASNDRATKFFRLRVAEGARRVIHRPGQHPRKGQSRVVRRRHAGVTFKDTPCPSRLRASSGSDTCAASRPA